MFHFSSFFFFVPLQVLKSSPKDYDRLLFNYSLKNQLRYKGNLGKCLHGQLSTKERKKNRKEQKCETFACFYVIYSFCFACQSKDLHMLTRYQFTCLCDY